MSNRKTTPRYNVISMRINETELRILESLMKKSHKNVSRIMREAFEHFTAHIELAKGGSTAM